MKHKKKSLKKYLIFDRIDILISLKINIWTLPIVNEFLYHSIHHCIKKISVEQIFILCASLCIFLLLLSWGKLKLKNNIILSDRNIHVFLRYFVKQIVWKFHNLLNMKICRTYSIFILILWFISELCKFLNLSSMRS